DFLGLAFVENFEIALLQVRHQFMAAIQDGEEHVDEVDFSHKRLAALRVALLAGRRSGGRRLLWLATRGGLLRPDGGGCKQDCRRQNSRDEGVSTLHGCKNYRSEERRVGKECKGSLELDREKNKI